MLATSKGGMTLRDRETNPRVYGGTRLLPWPPSCACGGAGAGQGEESSESERGRERENERERDASACFVTGGTRVSAWLPPVREAIPRVFTEAPAFRPAPRRGVIENNYSTDGQIAINRQIDVRELRVNAHTMVCGRSAITNRVRAYVWAFTHTLANVDLAVEYLFSITPFPVSESETPGPLPWAAGRPAR
jgi:hypothetical protein